ncbi:hypothetical protein EXIGLDRAFT_628865 [Exidia glandulosa HHB12029]|uniref:Uncharacterized protein n=1 Tax=Exidia glandulosa HHB12029 TaxID=1314781 RepID=A0A165BSG9_EXIGL|nr:hypothetical protein EXIGLDRAFT_628865 [Exidia glandulosa HHB12029]
MLVRGFTELREANSELAYNVILDVLSGINENNAVRQHVSTTRGLFPHRRITRKSEMTAKGLVVVEHEEEIVGPSVSTPDIRSPSQREAKEAKRSPIGELIYMRWLEGLRLKWPSIL